MPHEEHWVFLDDLNDDQRRFLALGVLATCQFVRMAATGSVAPSRSEWDAAREFLINRAADWKPSLPGREDYDGAVKALIEAALAYEPPKKLRRISQMP